MTDIVDRLNHAFPSVLAMRDGAEEIMRLRSQLEAARHSLSESPDKAEFWRQNDQLGKTLHRVEELEAYAEECRRERDDAEMMLRKIASKHRNGKPIPDDWWAHIERFAGRNANPLRNTDQRQAADSPCAEEGSSAPSTGKPDPALQGGPSGPPSDERHGVAQSAAATNPVLAVGIDWALRQGDVLADWCNVSGAALAALMDAYERRIRSLCTPEQINTAPWRCAEFIQAERALASKPVAQVVLSQVSKQEPPHGWAYQEHKPGAPNRDERGYCLECLENVGQRREKAERGHEGSIRDGLGSVVPHPGHAQCHPQEPKA